jgi:membrane-bound lytic murein transglycosylase A
MTSCNTSTPAANGINQGAKWLAFAAVAALAACTSSPPPRPPGPPVTSAAPSGSIARERSRWVPVAWRELPGWTSDTPQAAWPALLQSCRRSLPAWTALCADAQQRPPRNDAETRDWLIRHLQPYRVEAPDGTVSGLITGYYEPSFDARRTPGGEYRYALYSPPADLAARRPYWTREQLQTLPEARDSLRGHEIAYVANPLDALVLQIQGSGRLRITEPDGRTRTVRLAYAGHNDQPYRSIGRALIDQGELPAGQANWPAIKAWAESNPTRIDELLWTNPRYVFFREEALPDPSMGPRGAQGVPLTPGRSIAVDPKSVPYGAPIWIDTTEPLSNSPLRRLVLAQDTGSAIVGAVRADYFWGWDGDAAEQAGRMRQPLRMWVLWPRDSVN